MNVKPLEKAITVLVNFRADKATLEAIDKLTEAYVRAPGDVYHNAGKRSIAIRKALLEAAERLSRSSRK